MKENATRFFGGACAAALFACGAVGAETNEVANQDLLDLMESVAAQASANPVERAAAPLEVAAERAVEADVVMDAQTNAVLDDFEVGVIDVGSATTDGELITVRLDRVSLEKAINLFAQLSGANIIVPELSEGEQISVNLRDVEWRPALQSILDTYDYELYQRVSGSNVYAVRKRSPDAPEPQVVETFKLQYATVPNAAKLVRELLPEGAKVSEFASRNMLVVKSTESSLSEVRAVLEIIDQVRQQVFIESKFMELSDEAQKDLGIDWSVLQAYGAGTEGATERSYSRTDSTEDSSASFMDINGQNYEQAGSYAEDQRGGSGNPYTLGGVTPTASSLATRGATEVLTSVLSADEFRLVLSALEQSQGANIVSNPKIIVANEEKANISIVRQEPNLKQSSKESLNDTGDTVTYELDPDQKFFDFGIQLDVIPSINTASNITVQISPSLTRKYGDKEAGDNTYPIIDKKSINTTFSLASGQTAAIGGLTQVTESEVENKVPVLGSIPFLGRLFRYNQTVTGQEETLIFVTVGLANTQQLREDTGMPSDSELGRRQIIIDSNTRTLRDRGRGYFVTREANKLEDMIKVMDQEELERVRARDEKLRREAAKAARAAARKQHETYVD